MDLGRLEPDVDRVVIAASADGGTFGQVPGLSLTVADRAGAPIADFAITDARWRPRILFGELYRRAGAWKFRAVGQGYDSGLGGLARDFGISVDEEPEPAERPRNASSARPPPEPLRRRHPPPRRPVRAVR